MNRFIKIPAEYNETRTVKVVVKRLEEDDDVPVEMKPILEELVAFFRGDPKQEPLDNDEKPDVKPVEQVFLEGVEADCYNIGEEKPIVKKVPVDCDEKPVAGLIEQVFVESLEDDEESAEHKPTVKDEFVEYSGLEGCTGSSPELVTKHYKIDEGENFPKSHMRTHRGENPYHCNQCSYVVARKGWNLESMIHDAVKILKEIQLKLAEENDNKNGTATSCTKAGNKCEGGQAKRGGHGSSDTQWSISKLRLKPSKEKIQPLDQWYPKDIQDDVHYQRQRRKHKVQPSEDLGLPKDLLDSDKIIFIMELPQRLYKSLNQSPNNVELNAPERK